MYNILFHNVNLENKNSELITINTGLEEKIKSVSEECITKELEIEQLKEQIDILKIFAKKQKSKTKSRKK